MSTHTQIRKTTEKSRELGSKGIAAIHGRVAIILLIGALALSSTTPAVQAFGGEHHREITQEGLGSSPDDSFLRTSVLAEINNQHQVMDAGFPNSNNIVEDQKHFDDCEFDKSASFINGQYDNALDALEEDDTWIAIASFGNVIHTIQDLYSHANWVELGYPQSHDEGTPTAEFFGAKVAQADLLDLSGAQSPFGQRWFAPAGGAVVRDDILLNHDDWEPLVGDWSVKRNGAGLFVPTLIDPEGRTVGRLLQTGQGTGDDECEIWAFKPQFTKIFNGVKHENLNKDGPAEGASSQNLAVRLEKYKKARALASLQTGYEWCRLVQEAGWRGQDGLLLAMWVKEGGNPHPPATPCAPSSQGTTKVIVTIESIRILNDHEDASDDVGEIQLAAVLYDDPSNFHNSLHVSNRQGMMPLFDGDFVHDDQLPEPLTLCIAEGSRAYFTIHAWDNDDGDDDDFREEFDNQGNNHDDLLRGFQIEIPAEPAAGTQESQGPDLQVRYQLLRVDGHDDCVPGPNPDEDVTDDGDDVFGPVE